MIEFFLSDSLKYVMTNAIACKQWYFFIFILHIYGDASGITNEHVIYCDEFEKAFTEYVRKDNKKSYYENIYYPEKLKEQVIQEESEEER